MVRFAGDDDLRNQAMSGLRESIEWNYGSLKSIFRLLSQKTMSLRLRQSKVGDYLMISVLLRNMQVAFEGNISSGKFACNPPTFAEYVAQGPRRATGQ